ncbi:MAG: hypothetical protein FJ286_16060 [Planctomycetes bacterium]|nr:hypothetical protein [Planctomycetota bacterium]
MSKVVEFFGVSTASREATSEKLRALVDSQACPYRNSRCIKTRKSAPDVAIGTCVVTHSEKPVIICPHRMLERRKVFSDCIHLLSLHQPGNDFHVLPEVEVPGGMVDYFLVSSRGGKVRDFVGIELQTMDTTGTVWPERQRFLKSKGLRVDPSDVASKKPFGMNWKMTAKTILVQLHHKVETFSGWQKHLVLIVQDVLLDYIRREFATSHLESEARVGDPMHFHAYRIGTSGLELASRLSTDVEGVASALNRKTTAPHDLAKITATLEGRIGPATRLVLA